MRGARPRARVSATVPVEYQLWGFERRDDVLTRSAEVETDEESVATSMIELSSRCSSTAAIVSERASLIVDACRPTQRRAAAPG